MTTLKLGKAPATHDDKDLLFTQFEVIAKPPPAASVGFGHKGVVPQWGMLGNDAHGDCVWAGAAHETIMWNAIAGMAVPFDDKSVLSDYAAVAGFDPITGANDNGTNMRDAMNYRRHTGIVDTLGKRHLIGGYVALEPGNWNQLLQALFVFDAVAIGIQFPSSAMAQFNQGKPWQVVPGAKIEGGHYVPVVGRPGLTMLDIVTWGRVQQMTKSFYRRYADEAYGILSTETLKKGKSAEGYDLAGLQKALSAFGKPG